MLLKAFFTDRALQILSTIIFNENIFGKAKNVFVFLFLFFLSFIIFLAIR